jgi:two-component sensor histidine kinase
VPCSVLRLELANPSDDEARYRRLFQDSPIALCEQDFSGVKAYLDELAVSGVRDLKAYLGDHPDAVLAAARRVRFIEVNAATLNVYEATSREEILSSWPKLFGQEMGRVFLEELCFLIDGKETTFSAHCASRTLRGRKNEIHFRLTVLPGSEKTWARLVASIFDMTAYYEAERRLRATLREKDVLLKEVHHRVKNNLQVISSLLSLGAQHVTEGTARAVFVSSQSRVQSIALVHEKLYRQKDLSHVRFGEYVQTLITELLYSHSAAERDISAVVEIEDLPLPVNVAIPCGLIVNELVSNSLKHAFPVSRTGVVAVRAHRAPDGRIELVIEDDGRGLPSALDPRKAPSLGLDLVFTFADQLGATVDIRGYPGTRYVFAFREDHA